jgi:hypothetical protein
VAALDADAATAEIAAAALGHAQSDIARGSAHVAAAAREARARAARGDPEPGRLRRWRRCRSSSACCGAGLVRAQVELTLRVRRRGSDGSAARALTRC